MANYKKIEFTGKYKLFYPENELDDNMKSAISIMAKKLFGENTKIYFTDESPELLEEVIQELPAIQTNNTAQAKILPTFNTNPEQDLETKRKVLEEEKIKKGYLGRDMYMKQNDMGDLAKDKSLGRDRAWQ